MTAPALVEVPAADPMAAVRSLNRMKQAGFTLELDGTALVVSPADRLTEQQRAFLKEHKAALVALLNDAETVYEALQGAGDAGLDWLLETLIPQRLPPFPIAHIQQQIAGSVDVALDQSVGFPGFVKGHVQLNEIAHSAFAFSNSS